jgi:predicted histidine transporter YuiF (NhaC family)
MNNEVDKATNLVSILFYIYIFAGLLVFIISWLLYLSNVNTEINEAIRMLNMIPFKLLSSSRK